MDINEVYKNVENSGIGLTRLEKQFLANFINELYAEPGFSDVDCETISRSINESTKVCRGVLSSLIKKNIVWYDDEFDIIYLHSDFYYLHPIWKDGE